MTQNIDHSPVPAAPKLDYARVKARQKTVWAAGDFAVVGTTLQIVGEALCEAVDLGAGSKVLDVACGNGNATLAAARRFCPTTGLDYVPVLLDRARERAAAERLDVRLVEGDAENMPFEDASFDVVLSTFGVMFAPDQPKAAQEVARVCRPGGRIGLASWTPEGFIGQLLKTVGSFTPPPAGLSSPALWGSEQHVRELFGPRAAAFRASRPHFVFRYRSIEHFIEVFRTYYGPTNMAFAALEEPRREELAEAIAQLVRRFARRTSGSLEVSAEYLEVVIDRA